MRSTGSTSAKWGPDDPADGLHPVLHVALGAGHEQERLGVGRHLLPLPGTTCKTGDTGLLQGILHNRDPGYRLPPHPPPRRGGVGEGRLSQTGSNFLVPICQPPRPTLPTPFTLFEAFPGFSVLLWSLLHFYLETEIIRAPGHC